MHRTRNRNTIALPNPTAVNRIASAYLFNLLVDEREIWREMKTKTVVLTMAVCLAAVAVSFASNPNMGTWKLNEAKSKIPAGAPKNTTVVYEASGDSVKVTTDGTGRDGKPSHTEWTGKFDGKDYPLTGDSSADSRSYKTIDDHTLELTNKMGGKVVATGRV